jgi:HEAT repeat protein
MDPALSIKNNFPPEDQPVVTSLAKFTLSFVQALLKAGYYQLGNLGLTVAKKGLYQELQELHKNNREISFMIHNQGGTADILVYGILSEASSLKKLFSPDMAGPLVVKFRDYFDRRRLVSVTLTPGMTYEEFDGFIEIMSEPPAGMYGNEAIALMTGKWVARHIVHVSVLYTEELDTSNGALNWMTQIILARLNKDLQIIPFYKHLTAEQMLLTMRQVFAGLLQPVRNITVLKEILVNGDRIAPISIEATQVVDIEAEFSHALRADQRLPVLLECTHDLQAISPQAKKESARAHYERLLSVIKKMALSISFDQIQEEACDLIATLVSEGIVTLETLPEKLIAQVKAKQATDAYLHNKTEILETLEKGWQEPAVLQPICVIPALLGRNEFVEMESLCAGLQTAWEKGLGLGPGLGLPKSQFYTQMGVDAMAETLLSKLRNNQLAQRKDILPVLERFSRPLSSSLIPLCADPDIWVRRNICRILARLGDLVIPDLVGWAEETTRHWYFVRNIVMILGDIGSTDEAARQFLRRYQQHASIPVREEVLMSFGKIKGEQMEGYLLHELGNKSILLRNRAVLSLGNFYPVPEPFLTFLQETLRKKRKEEAQVDERIEISSCLAVEVMAAFDLKKAQSFEPLLIDALTPDKSFLGLREKHQEKGYEVRRAICKLLGVIGTEKAVPMLTWLLKEKQWLPQDKDMVLQGLKGINRRAQLII